MPITRRTSTKSTLVSDSCCSDTVDIRADLKDDPKQTSFADADVSFESHRAPVYRRECPLAYEGIQQGPLDLGAYLGAPEFNVMNISLLFKWISIQSESLQDQLPCDRYVPALGLDGRVQ